MYNGTDLASGSMALPELPPAETLKNDIDALIAAELNELSMQERDDVLHDIHGVSDVTREDPEVIQRSLAVLLNHLATIPETEKQAYILALHQNAAYVHDEKFLLMFLRSDCYNIPAAASRLVAFFETKMELFGKETLARDILISDLDENDIACLESGYAQILGGRDRAGRAIFCLMPTIRKYKTIENRLRAIYMVIMFALQDEETQKRGIVGLAYNVGRDHTKDREAVWKAAKIVSILPHRFTGVHYCYDDEKIKMLFNLAMYVFNKNARFRCRLHYGTPMECIYTLMTFGIPSDILPVSPSGELRLERHEEYIQKMYTSENLKAIIKIPRVVLPGKFDVLLGRGKPLQKHFGNLNYHYVIEGYHSHYEQATKLEKTQIAKDILEKIKEQGGRFLKQDDVGWLEIEDEAARAKISHTFRNHRIAARTAFKKATEVRDSGIVEQRRRSNPGGALPTSIDGSQSFGFADMSLGPANEIKRRRVDSDQAMET